MIEFYIILSIVVLFLIIRAVRRKGTPVAGTAVGTGVHRWYQNISPAQWLTIALWFIGIALAWLIANKYWRIETGVVLGEWSSSRENLWITILSLALLGGVVIKAVLFRREHAGGGEGEKKRPSVGGVFSAFVGLAFLVALVALTALLVLKAWHEFEFGLSNAPERFAARGYVPREQVAAALAASAPALPEVHTVTAPPLGADGKTNWSEAVICDRRFWTYFGVSDEMRDYVVRRADGAVTNFVGGAGAITNLFATTTTNAVSVKWLQNRQEMTPEKVKELLN